MAPVGFSGSLVEENAVSSLAGSVATGDALLSSHCALLLSRPPRTLTEVWQSIEGHHPQLLALALPSLGGGGR